MNKLTRMGASAAVLGLLLLTPLGASGADAPTAAEVTAGDNAALAAGYEAEAKSLRAKAESHREMLAAYDKSPAYKRQHPGGGLAVMKQHCQKLIDSYTSAAAEAEALAKEHQGMEGAGH